MIKPQVITKDGEAEYVVLSIEEWRKVQALLEELDDIRDLEAAEANPNKRMIPFEVTSVVLDGANPIRAWRERRGLTQRELAAAAGIAAPYLSQLETGRRRGAAAVLRNLARALDTHVDDLIAETAEDDR